mgnify:CR=1 FL=1
MEEELRKFNDVSEIDDVTLRRAKRFGFSDRQLATVWHGNEFEIREQRKQRGIIPTFKSVDTCRSDAVELLEVLVECKFDEMCS